MKQVSKLVCKNQNSQDWMNFILNECKNYPLNKLDINNEDLIIDVGANVGAFFIAWNHLSSNWILVEPSTYNCEEIEKNLLNKKFKLIKRAVSSKSNEILKLQKYIYDGGDTASGNFGLTQYVDKNNNGWKGDYEEVISISFEDLAGNLDIGLLKIDCEGSEYNFLMNKDLSRVKYIFIEIHNFLEKGKIENLHNFLSTTHNIIFQPNHDYDLFHKNILWEKK